jgi:hypothetical protein
MKNKLPQNNRSLFIYAIQSSVSKCYTLYKYILLKDDTSFYITYFLFYFVTYFIHFLCTLLCRKLAKYEENRIGHILNLI